MPAGAQSPRSAGIVVLGTLAVIVGEHVKRLAPVSEFLGD